MISKLSSNDLVSQYISFDRKIYEYSAMIDNFAGMEETNY